MIESSSFCVLLVRRPKIDLLAEQPEYHVLQILSSVVYGSRCILRTISISNYWVISKRLYLISSSGMSQGSEVPSLSTYSGDGVTYYDPRTGTSDHLSLFIWPDLGSIIFDI